MLLSLTAGETMVTQIKRPKKVLKTLVFAFLLFCLTTALLLPTLLSTALGQKKILELINERIDGTLSVQNISLSLTGPQRFQGIELKNSNGTLLASIDSFTKAESLVSLYFKGLLSGSNEIKGLHAEIIAYQDGTNNVQRSLSPTQPKNSNLSIDSTSIASDLSPLSSPIILSETDLLVNLSENITIKGHGRTKHGKIEGTFSSDITLEGVSFEELGTLSKSLQKLAQNTTASSIKFSAENFPVALLDSFVAWKNPSLKDTFPLLFGPTLALKIEEDKEGRPSSLPLNIEIKSANLAANFQAEVTSDKITLAKPGTVIYALNPEFADIFLRGAGIRTLKLSEPTQFFGVVESLTLPFGKESLFNFNELGLTSRIDLSQAEFYDDAIIGDMALKKFTATLDTTPDSPYLSFQLTGEASQSGQPIHVSIASEVQKSKTGKGFRIPPVNIDISRIPIPLVDYILGLDDLLVDAIGHEADIKIQTKKEKKETEITFSFNSERLRIPSMIVSLSDKLYVKEPPVLHYTLGKNFSERLFSKDSLLKLPVDVPFQATFSLDPIANFEQISSLETLNLSGVLAFDTITFNVQSQGDTVSLHDMRIPWSLDGTNNSLNVSFNGKPEWSGDSTSGSMDGKVLVQGLAQAGEINWKGSKISADLNLSHVPTTFLNLFLQKKEIAIILGSKLDVKIESQISLNETPSGFATFVMKGQEISGSGQFNFDHTLSLKDEQPLTCDLILTPERFNALRSFLKTSLQSPPSKDTITLLDNAKIHLKVNSLLYPLKSNTPSRLTEIAFDTDLSADRLAILDTRDGQSLTFEEVTAHLNADDLKTQSSFNIVAKQRSRDKASEFLLKGRAYDALNPDGSLNIEGLSVQFDSKIADLPLDVFCRVICLGPNLNQKIEALFGQTLDADMHVNLNKMNGPIQAKLIGENGTIHLDATLNQGNLFLNSPFFAECAVTPKLGRSILQDVFPLLSGIVVADQPLQISIDNRGFYFPIKDFDFRSLSIQNASISLGKVKFSNQGQLGEILSLLTPPESELIVVWFTPLYLNLTEGNLTLQRIDMLISDRFPIATWGSVNFIKDRVDMVIGLSGYALSHAFDLGPLDPNDFLQIPLKGTTANASIDKRRATARISALVAQSHGSPQGLVIGTVLNIVSGGLTEERSPPPTTNPLPWANSLPEQKVSPKEEEIIPEPVKERKKKKSKKIDPVKEAGSLINELLR